MSSELLKSLENVGRTLEVVGDRQQAIITQQRELADRVTSLEQRGANPPADPTATDPTGQRKGAGIVKVHNSRDPLFIVSNKARVADVLPANTSGISLGRYLAAGLLGEKCGDAEALRHVRDTKSVSTATSGLVVPAEYQGEWIDLMRAESALVKAGAVTVPMAGATLNMAALTADPTAGWHAEGTADISASDPTFAARTLTARTIAARCTVTLEVAQDSPQFGEQLAVALGKAISVEADRAGLVGSGTPPEPRGLLNVSGINAVGTVGSLASYAKVIEGVQLLLEDNVPLEIATAYALMSPRTWGRFENLATGITSDLSPLPRPRSLENTQFITTTAIPNTLSTDKSALFLGDFRNMVMGTRADLTVEVVKTTTFASSLVLEFVAYARVDWCCIRPAAFCALTGIA